MSSKARCSICGIELSVPVLQIHQKACRAAADAAEKKSVAAEKVPAPAAGDAAPAPKWAAPVETPAPKAEVKAPAPKAAPKAKKEEAAPAKKKSGKK